MAAIGILALLGAAAAGAVGLSWYAGKHHPPEDAQRARPPRGGRARRLDGPGGPRQDTRP